MPLSRGVVDDDAESEPNLAAMPEGASLDVAVISIGEYQATSSREIVGISVVVCE